MEPVLEWLVTVWHVILASIFALTPGMLVWLVVLSIVLAVRWVSHSGPYQRLFHGGRTV